MKKATLASAFHSIRVAVTLGVIACLIAESLARPCELGLEKYSPAKKRCTKCKCRKGYGQDKIQATVTVDDTYGALTCPACTKCSKGYYSNKNTGFICAECNTPCTKLFKETIQKCNGKRVNLCGACQEGYYNPHPYTRSFPCRLIKTQTTNKRRIQSTFLNPSDSGYRSLGKTVNLQSTSSYPPDSGFTSSNNAVELMTGRSTEDSNIEIARNSYHLESTTVLLIILCFVGCVAILVFVSLTIYKCRQNSDNRTNNFGSTSSGRSLLGTKHKGRRASAGLETDGINEWRKENYEKMVNIFLEPSDKYVRYVSSRIDKDPDDFFEELKVGGDVIFQEKHLKDKHDYPEYVIRVLNRWIGKQDRQVPLSTLYSALDIRHYDGLCHGLDDLANKPK